MTEPTRKEDFFNHLYRNLYGFGHAENKSLEELSEDLQMAGVDTASLFKKAENLVKRHKMEMAAEKKSKEFAQKIPKLENLKINLPADTNALLAMLQKAFGSGQAQMALRNYNLTNKKDLESLAEDLRSLEAVDEIETDD